MPEILVPFTSRQAWDDWMAAHPWAQRAADAVVADARRHGVVEPLSGLHRPPAEVRIDESNLRETLACGEMNARKRALLLTLAAAAHARGWDARGNAVVKVPEAGTRIARVLAEHYATPEGRLPPGTQVRLESLGLRDASADAVVVIDAFDTVDDPEAAWAGLRRALRPGGLVVAAVGFAASRTDEEPFMSPGGRCGWGLIRGLQARGFAEAAMVLVGSSQHGIAANTQPGVMVLVARAPGGPEGVPLLHPVAWPGHLPEKVCLLVALPRSGTTLTTALFDVHSRFDAVYEPWNAKLLAGPEEARIETLLARAKLGTQPGRFLFVKETAAQQAFVDNIRRLYDATAVPLDLRVLMLLRKPSHTFLSEVERRKEWWGADVDVNQEQFDLWCAKTRLAVRSMLALLSRAGGSMVCYERMAEDPGAMLARLARAVGFEAEPRQLEFEKHLDTKKVRGDLNVSKNPEPVSAESIRRRGEREADVDRMVVRSPHGGWFRAFTELHRLLYDSWIGIPDVTALRKAGLI